MIPLNKVKFEDLRNYLDEQQVWGFFASRRKHTIIYTFKRYIGSKKHLTIKIKVMRKTKYVASVLYKDVVYTDYDELKKLIET